MVIWDRDIWFDRDPFADIDRLRRRMNRLLSSGLRPGLSGAFPPINLWSGSDKVVLSAEVPGVEKEDMDISVENDVLTLKGQREPEKLEEGEAFRRSERGYGAFRRVIGLPFAVDPEQVSAQYKDGILRIELKRHEASKPKRIEVK